MIHELSGKDCQAILKERDDIQIIDVRNESEFDEFHLPGAIHIDIMSNHAVESFSMLKSDANYLVYCAIGVRSKSALRLMEQLDFTSLYHLTDGILNYRGEVVTT
jgi:rhodanese-related sulfurtransferase